MMRTMDRRDFLSQSARLGVLTALAGACTDGGSISGLGQDVVVDLAAYPALAEVGGVARISGVRALALVNMGSGSFAAFSLSCPHQGTTVQWTGSAFVCPNHGARFAGDGHWTGGERTSNLREYVTEYDATAGTVLVLAG